MSGSNGPFLALSECSPALYRYCFGAPSVCDELAKDTCTAGAFAHPAFLKDEQIRAVKSTFLACVYEFLSVKVL